MILSDPYGSLSKLYTIEINGIYINYTKFILEEYESDVYRFSFYLPATQGNMTAVSNICHIKPRKMIITDENDSPNKVLVIKGEIEFVTPLDISDIFGIKGICLCRLDSTELGAVMKFFGIN